MKKIVLIGALILLCGLGLACGGAQKAMTLSSGPMPEGGNFDGVYQSDFGWLELTVSGDVVHGLYEDEKHSGKLEGKIDGSLLHFSWTQWTEDMQGRTREISGHGTFKYVMEKVETSFKPKTVHRLKGIWGYGNDPMVNIWNAYRLSNRTKKRLQPRNMEPDRQMPGAADYDDGQGFAEPSEGEEEPTEDGL